MVRGDVLGGGGFGESERVCVCVCVCVRERVESVRTKKQGIWGETDGKNFDGGIEMKWILFEDRLGHKGGEAGGGPVQR